MGIGIVIVDGDGDGVLYALLTLAAGDGISGHSCWRHQ